MALSIEDIVPRQRRLKFRQGSGRDGEHQRDTGGLIIPRGSTRRRSWLQIR